MTRLLLLDDAQRLAAGIAADLREELGLDVTVISEIWKLPALLSRQHFDFALVDLSFPHQKPRSGADALLHLHLRSPETRLAIITQGDGWVARLMQDVWDALPIETVLSKTQLNHVAALDALMRGERFPIDSALRLTLSEKKDPERALVEYRRLFEGHVGYKRLWKALIRCTEPVIPKKVAECTGLDGGTAITANVVNAYRQDTTPRLEKLKFPAGARLEEMGQIAKRVRPFLLWAMDEWDELESQTPNI